MYGTVDTCGQGWTELFCVALFWLKHSLQSTATALLRMSGTVCMHSHAKGISGFRYYGETASLRSVCVC